MAKGKNRQVITGSKEAVSGYRFQFIWSARRCLSMLRPGSSVAQVVIEGLHPDDEIDLGEGLEKFLGIDISEYHGGCSFQDAERIVVSQVKCGVRHPNKVWTVTRLCAGKKGDPKSSVVGRLADIFQAFLSDSDIKPSDVLKKLRLQIVSNRPLDTHCRKLITKAQDYFHNIGLEPSVFQFRHIMSANLTKTEYAQLNALRSASRLKSNEFVIFLLCLNIDHFDIEEPAFQSVRYFQETLTYDAVGPHRSVSKLYDLIENAATKGTGIPIRKDDVLACLETNKENFFPAPCLIDHPFLVIDTEDCQKVAELLKDTDTRKTLIHGKAGIGKSITMINLQRHLPSGSKVVVFDCYAKGETKTPDKARFPESVACTQIVNELSTTINTDIYLFRNRATPSDLWGRLQEAITKAAQSLSDKNSLLIVVIDAADNAVKSFDDDTSPQRERCFVPFLWDITLPDNACLIMTSRTYRRDTLKPPEDIKEFVLKGFSEQNSCLHMQSVLPNVDTSLGSSFHNATDGVPRLQYYWLDRLKNMSVPDVSLEIKQRNAFGLEDEYTDWLDSAKNVLPANLDYRTAIAVLRKQASPVVLSVFSGALNIEESTALQFCQGLEPGIVLDEKEKQIRFRDEDFEAFLDDKLSEEDVCEAHRILSDYCLTNIKQNIYTSLHVSNHLFKAHRYRKVVETALNKIGLDIITDPIKRLEIEIDRISLGLRSTIALDDYQSALRLLFVAAQCSRTRNVNWTILSEFPELAIQYGQYEAVREAVKSVLDRDSEGKLNFRIAAEMSRQAGSKREVSEHLKKGEAWLHLQISAARKHQRSFRYDIDDSVACAMAHFYLHGPSAAEHTIRRWRHGKDRLQAAYRFFRSLSLKEGRRQTLKAYKACPSLSVVQAAACAGMFESGIKPQRNEIRSVLDRFVIWAARHEVEQQVLGIWVLPFLELCALSGMDAATLVRVFDYSKPKRAGEPYSIYSPDFWYKEWDEYTRLVTLRYAFSGKEATIQDLFPDDSSIEEKLKESSNQRYYRSDSSHEGLHQIRSLLPVYNLRAQTLTKHPLARMVEKQIRNLSESWSAGTSGHWYKGNSLYQVFVRVALDALLKARGAEPSVIESLIEPAEKILGHNSRYLLLEVANALRVDKSYHGVAEDLIEQARNNFEQPNMRASEAASGLMECSEILLTIDPNTSSEYFQKAIEIASRVDDDAPFLLRAIASTAVHCVGDASHDDRIALADRLVKALDELYPLVDEERGVPWEAYINAIAALDSQIGFSAVLSLHRKGWLSLIDAAKGLVKGLLKGEQIDEVDAFQLIELGNINSDYAAIALNILEKVWQKDKAGCQRLFERISKDVMRDTDYSVRGEMCQTFLSWAREHDLSAAIIKDLEECHRFYADRLNWASDERSLREIPNRNDATIKKLFRKVRQKEKRDVGKILDQILKTPDMHRSSLEMLLNELAQCLTGKERLKFLEKLTRHPTDYYSNLSTVIPELLDKLLFNWSSIRQVREWVVQGMLEYFEEHLPELFRYDIPYASGSHNLLENPLIKGKGGPSVLLPALARHVGNMPATRVYELTGIFARYVPKNEAKEVVNGILRAICHEKQTDDGDLRKNTVMADGGLSKFLYNCFEQPDNRIRWRAFHATRRMLEKKSEPLLKDLVEASHSTEGKMWMSAREWLLFLFLHLAKKWPDKLLPYAQRIYEHAASKSFPHAGIQELAKRTLLVLIKEDASILSEKQQEYLRWLNEPRQCILSQERQWPGVGRKSHMKREWRFHFDHMDTFPYWYSPLSHCFGLHRCDVGMRAEPWICDVWGVTFEDCIKYSRENRHGYDWQLFSHRHGSHPTIESLGRYVERHAMFMAAGEMIRELPILSEKDYEIDSWHEWISRRRFDADPAITADIRCPVPLRKDLHGQVPEDFVRKGSVDKSAFVDQIAYRHGTEQFLVVAGNYSIRLQEVSINFDIDSALVSSKTAKALALAIQANDNPYSIGLPLWKISWDQNIEDTEIRLQRVAEKGWDVDFEISWSGFELQPWVANFHSEREMHSMDNKWQSLSRTWHTIGLDFVNRFSLNRLADSVVYFNAKGDCVVKPEVWDDVSLSDQYDRKYSQGNRLSVRRDELLDYLSSRKKDLFVRVVISKYFENKDNRPEDYDYGQAKVFIIHQSGRIEGLGKCS